MSTPQTWSPTPGSSAGHSTSEHSPEHGSEPTGITTSSSSGLSPSGRSSPTGTSTPSESHHHHRLEQPLSVNVPPRSPPTPVAGADEPLLMLHRTSDRERSTTMSSTASVARQTSSAFVSSPLNPNTPVPSSSLGRSRPASSLSMFLKSPTEEATGFSTGGRGSMLLYRLATEVDEHGALTPPSAPGMRDSYASVSGESSYSLSGDSKYPTDSLRGLIPYTYDPDADLDMPDDDEDALHRFEKGAKDDRGRWFTPRAFINVGALALLISCLLALFIAFPAVTYYRDHHRNEAIDNNVNVNSTGQVPSLFGMPELVDPDTPQSARTRTGFDGEEYELVFSDEFNVDGRTFYPGDDPYWEAVDLWYWATNDEEWYDPGQITTANGSLQITLEEVTWHGLPYRSGMLQSWNKFCFSSGYIEVSLTLPGPNEDTQGYWPGAWTMGNLGRPGYGATTDGTWPYSYDSCDVGTFPNQTWLNGTGPAAATYNPAGKSKYDYKLSYLTGQRLSSCTCPGQDHPGPSVSVGRGAPEIDILEAEKDKVYTGQVVSQSAQFAPFSHEYYFDNTSSDAWTIYNSTLTRQNPYQGSAVQQAVSGLTTVPSNMFQGSGQQFTTFGFEYYADSNPDDGFITWQVNGNPTVRMGASAVGPDQGEDGSGVSQRLIPVEPMSIVLNLGISTNWQTISLDTMEFPAIMLVDYVRVYQRKGKMNIGCNPKSYPTEDYINRHYDAYNNPNLTTWTSVSTRPKNSAYDGC